MNEAELVRSLLEEPCEIAVVGLSERPERPSHSVSAYMQRHGFRIYPVNPAVDTVLGERSYRSLTELVAAGVRPKIVNVFRVPSFLPGIVDEMLALGLGILWVQQGIVHREAAERAEAGGIRVVMDRCLMVEHRQASPLPDPLPISDAS